MVNLNRVAVLGLVGAVAVGGADAMQQRRVVNRPGSAAIGSTAVVAGGLVFVSAIRGVNAQGQVAGLDISAQTANVLERLADSLEAAGSSLGQTATVHVFLKQASDFEAMNAVYRKAFSDNPPTRTTIVSDLADGALVEMSAVAVPNGALRETMHPAGWMKSPRPYSYIVRTQDFVFLSGLVSRRGSDDQPVTGPMATQVKTVLDNAGELLKTAGVSYQDVVSARVFITDTAAFQEMNGEYRKYFATDPPVRATVVTALMGATSNLEITLVASRVGRQIVVPGSGTTPLSSAIRAGRLLFLAGMLGNTADNATDVAAQTRETLNRASAALQKGGVAFGDVADHVVYLPDLASRRLVDPILRETFPKDPPATTVIGAKLVSPTGLVELMMTAGVK
jgi:2-iminobutanoate/2-iminopropanoate deaminase